MILGLGNTIPSDSVRQGLGGGGGGGGFDNTYSLSMDGVDDKVTFSSISASDEFTVSLWLKPTAFNNNSASYVFGIHNNNSNFLKLQSATSIQLYISYSFITLSNGGSGNDIALNQWQNLILIRNSSNVVTAYLNGVAWSTSATVSSTLTINSIGRIINASFGYNGSVDEFSFWQSDETANVSTIYNSGVPNDLTSLNPVTWYRMGDNGSYKSPQWLIPENSNVANSRISNYSLQLDGVDDYIDFGDSDTFSFGNGSTDSPFSISAWVKMTDATTFRIVTKYDTSAKEYFFATDSTDKVLFRLYDDSTGGILGRKYNTALTSFQGQWIHLVATYDGSGNNSGLKIYLNGAQVDNGNVNSGSYTAMENTTQPLEIGKLTTTNANGYIDETAIFSSELTSENVPAIYNSGTPTTLPVTPVAHWKMGEEANFTDNWLVNNSALSNYSTRSFNFDGVDDRIDVGAVSFLPSATNLTVSTWLKTSDVTDNQVVFGDNSATPIFSFEYWGSNNRMYFEYGSGLYCYLTLNSVVSNDVWHNLALVYDGSGATNTDKIKIYINGVDKSSSLTFVGTVPTALNASIGNLWLGNGQNYNSPFLGNIDEFAIWNSSLTQENITSIYGGGTPSSISSLSPISHWRMGEDATFSTNWSLPDNGSASNTGTSANMTIADLEGDAPNYTGGGLSNNMTIEDRVGDAPNSTSNALSYNMTESDRETNVPS